MNYDEPKNISKENRLQLELASWIYQSHLWKRAGIAEDNIVCEWCGAKLGGPATLSTKDDLCPGNPKIEDMRREWIEKTLKGMRKAEEIIKESRTPSPSTETFMSGGIGYDKTIEKKKQG